MVTRATVKAAPIPSALDDVAGSEQKLLDRELVLRGKFKDEIARFNTAKADAEEKLGMIATVEDAARVKEEADSHARATRLEADKAAATAQDLLAVAVAKGKTVDSNEAELAQREAVLQERVAALKETAAKLEAFEAQITARASAASADLVARGKALAQEKAEHGERVKALAEREKRLNARLDALKTTDV